MILVDSGVFIAAADRDEARHGDCAEVLRAHRDLVVASPVIAETAWMIENRLGVAAEGRFLRLVTSDRVEVVDLTATDYARAIELVETYADLGLGFVDASVVAVCERLDVVRVATLNRRDFAVVRPAHCEAFELVP